MTTLPAAVAEEIQTSLKRWKQASFDKSRADELRLPAETFEAYAREMKVGFENATLVYIFKRLR